MVSEMRVDACAEEERTCALLECPARFRPRRPWQEFCCDAHRYAAANRKKAEARVRAQREDEFRAVLAQYRDLGRDRVLEIVREVFA